MTLEETLLRKLADWRVHNSRQTLSAEYADWRVDVTADAVDTVGARLWEVALYRTSAQANPATLAAQAERIVSRITGLMEPLRLIEIDEPRGVAQLRSTSPAAKGDTLFYYEVTRQAGGQTTLRRYQASTTSPKREQIAFPLTHEALAKLVDDLATT